MKRKRNVHPKASYKIKKIKVAADGLSQPEGVKAGILPKHPFRLYIVGASGSGKTNLLVNLLLREDMYANYFDSIVVLSPTARRMDPMYKALKLPDRAYFSCDEDVLERIKELQEEEVENKPRKKARKLLVVIDDFISFKSFANSEILLQFAVMSRHWNTSMCLLSQAYHRTAKSIRLQMSAIAYFKGSNKEMQVLAEDFGAPGLSNKEFIERINYATAEEFNFFFIDLHRPVNKNRYRKNLDEVIIPKSRSLEYKDDGKSNGENHRIASDGQLGNKSRWDLRGSGERYDEGSFGEEKKVQQHQPASREVGSSSGRGWIRPGSTGWRG